MTLFDDFLLVFRILTFQDALCRSMNSNLSRICNVCMFVSLGGKQKALPSPTNSV